jgi:ribosomal protein L37E
MGETATIAAIRCPLCGAKELRFGRESGTCRSCGFSGPVGEVTRHVETELEKLRTKLERLRHEKTYNTEYLVRELAEARKACNLNTLSIAGTVAITLFLGWVLYPWHHSEYIYLALVCVAVIVPLVMKRRWLNKVLREKEADIGERIKDVAEDLDGKARAVEAEVEETEEFLANISGST